MKTVLRTFFSATLLCIALARDAGAVDYTWDGDTDGAWNNADNWVGNIGFPGVGDKAIFQGSVNTTVDASSNPQVDSIEFADNNAFTIQNGTITLSSGGDITKKATGTVNQTITSNLQLGGPVTFRNDNNWVHQAHKLILSGTISGGGTVTIEGTGNAGVQLGGNNAATFTGAIVMNSGALLPYQANCLGDTGAGLTVNGGLIWWSSNANNIPETVTIAANASWSNLNGMTLNGAVQVNGGVTLTSSQGGGNYLGLNGALTGGGDINFTAGNVEMKGTAANTLSGKITVDKGNTSLNDLKLNKSGVTAVAGDLAVQRSARVRWFQSDQIADTSSVTGSGNAKIEILQYTDTISSLTLTDSAGVDTTGGGVLTVSSLTVGGVPQSAGTYTSSETWITGEGSVVVPWVGAPDTPANPTPADTATDIAINTNLDWDDTGGADGYEVRLWIPPASKPGTPTATVTASVYDPPSDLNVSETYSWEIVATNASGTTAGSTWTFTTASGLTPPSAPTTPSPADSAADVPPSTVLDWADSAGASGYEVFLWIPPAGKPGTPTAMVSSSQYDPPGSLAFSTGYSWQITATNTAGTTDGAVWTFTTAARSPIFTWDGGGADNKWDTEGNWTTDADYPHLAGDTAIFQGSVRTTVDASINPQVDLIEFADANAFTIQNGTITLSSAGSITKKTAGTVNQTVTSNLQLGGPVTFRNDNSWVHNAHKLILAGTISGAGQITIEGTGNAGVEITGNNGATFTGPAVVNSGMLLTGNPNCLGDTLAGLTQTGGQIWWSGAANNMPEPVTVTANATWANLSGMQLNGAVHVNGGVTLTSGQGGGNYLGLNGALTGGGDINFTAGNVEMKGTAANTLSGKITIDKGNTSLNDLKLNKSDVTAVAGDLEVKRFARVRWFQRDQIADTSAVIASGDARLEILPYTDSISSLTLTDSAIVDTTGGGVLTVQFLTVGGVAQAAGTYTSAESYITGDGSVVVLPILPLGTLFLVR